MTDSVDGIDRRASRYRRLEIERAFARHAPKATTDTPLPASQRETPDASQVIGIPLFIMRTPPWRRQDWAEPQQPPTRP